MKHAKTLKLRIKDKHAITLLAMAREVNLAWNYCNETSHRAIRERYKWLSGFDLQKLTNGLSKCEGVLIGSPTVQQVCEDYAKARNQFKRSRLNWRVSNPQSSKNSLGWVPFKARAVQYKNGQVQFAGFKFGLWDSYGLSNYALRAGSFSEDSRGRWYLNICVQVDSQPSGGTAAVGIDLGLKTAATTSDGQVLVGRQYRALERKLGIAQRAGKKARVRVIHAKIKNQRKDAQHKFSTALVERCAAIFVGDVASSKLVKTKMAKSTLDAGWSQLKTMLEHKCQRAGVVFEVVNERYTTQTCSCCGSISDSSPKGRAGLRIREWTCMDCGTAHDRDINAARNILAAGHRRLAVGIHALKGMEDVKKKLPNFRPPLIGFGELRLEHRGHLRPLVGCGSIKRLGLRRTMDTTAYQAPASTTLEYELQLSDNLDAVWLHASDGSTVGRFGRMGIDLHNTVTHRVQSGAEMLACSTPAVKVHIGWLLP